MGCRDFLFDLLGETSERIMEPDKATLEAIETFVASFLNEAEAETMSLIYFNGGEKQSLIKVARTLGVSTETVRQRSSKAMKKLRFPGRARKIRTLALSSDPDELRWALADEISSSKGTEIREHSLACELEETRQTLLEVRKEAVELKQQLVYSGLLEAEKVLLEELQFKLETNTYRALSAHLGAAATLRNLADLKDFREVKGFGPTRLEEVLRLLQEFGIEYKLDASFDWSNSSAWREWKLAGRYREEALEAARKNAGDDSEKLSIAELELPVSAYNSLTRAGVETIADLRTLIEKGGLESIRGLGKKNRIEVLYKMAEFDGVEM